MAVAPASRTAAMTLTFSTADIQVDAGPRSWFEQVEHERQNRARWYRDPARLDPATSLRYHHSAKSTFPVLSPISR